MAQWEEKNANGRLGRRNKLFLSRKLFFENFFDRMFVGCVEMWTEDKSKY